MPQRPDPRAFTDYRDYLGQMVIYLKANSSTFSYRKFSQKAGFSSPNFLKLVIDGKRNLSTSSIPKFAQALGLSDAEHEIFEALVLFAQAETSEERARYQRRLDLKQSISPTTQLEKDQFDIYANWYVSVIREMVLWPDFQENPDWIAARLKPRIRPQQAAEALKLLERVGLLVRNEQGTLKASDQNIHTPPRILNLAFRNYHRAMLKNVVRAVDRVNAKERNVSAITVSLSREDYEAVCEKIGRFREELMDFVADRQPEQTTPEVHYVGFQVVPVTRSSKS